MCKHVCNSFCVCIQYHSSGIRDKLEVKLNSGPSFKMADRKKASSDRVTARPPFLKGTLRWMFFFLIKSPDWKTEESVWHCFVFSIDWLQSSTVRLWSVWINFLNSKISFFDSNNFYRLNVIRASDVIEFMSWKYTFKGISKYKKTYTDY